MAPVVPELAELLLTQEPLEVQPFLHQSADNTEHLGPLLPGNLLSISCSTE